MGKFDFSISDDFIRQLGRLADVERVAPKMIDEAMPILEANFKKELQNHKQTGDMIRSVKRTKAGKTKKGDYYASVRPTGTDSKGVRNMEKLASLEFGVKGKDGQRQAPTPILTKAIKDSESAVYAKMAEVFDREVGK